MFRKLLFAVIAFAMLSVFAAGESFTAPKDSIGTDNSPTTYKALEESTLDASAELYAVFAEIAKQKSKAKREEAEAKSEAEAVKFAEEFGEKSIEVLTRMTEPHLKPVFRHLLKKGEWHIKMRALYWLTNDMDTESAPVFVECLSHENSLVRELAAIGLPMVIDPKLYKKEFSANVESRLKSESNSFVSSALKSSVELLKAGKKPEIVFEMFSAGEDGRKIRPYISGYTTPKGYVPKTYNRSGKVGNLKPADKWSYPLSGFHRKIVAGLSSVPFGALKTPTVYHLGEDVAWFEQGAGYFAIADGIVRMVQHGGDWGGLIIVEHRISDDEYCCALYGHAGRFLFAPAGTEVKAGQIIGTMGLSFSLENGGHGSHCHFGIFKGRFDTKKCVGYRSTSAGKDDFHDPIQFLDSRLKVENTQE